MNKKNVDNLSNMESVPSNLKGIRNIKYWINSTQTVKKHAWENLENMVYIYIAVYIYILYIYIICICIYSLLVFHGVPGVFRGPSDHSHPCLWSGPCWRTPQWSEARSAVVLDCSRKELRARSLAPSGGTLLQSRIWWNGWIADWIAGKLPFAMFFLQEIIMIMISSFLNLSHICCSRIHPKHLAVLSQLHRALLSSGKVW